MDNVSKELSSLLVFIIISVSVRVEDMLSVIVVITSGSTAEEIERLADNERRRIDSDSSPITKAFMFLIKSGSFSILLDSSATDKDK